MEVGSELLWNAISAILLCFLVARLVFLVLSFSVPPPHDELKEKGSKRAAAVDLDHDHGGHKKQVKTAAGGERLSKIRGSGGKKKKRVKFVDQAAAKAVDFEEFLGKEIQVIEVGSAENEEKEGIVRRESGEEEMVDHGMKEANLVEFEGDEGRERFSTSDQKEDEDEGMLSDEEEWEGIERSELEKEFGRARDFVERGDKEGRFAMVGNDVMMEFYGLQKVAMEGPCHEPQPMALKLSARAKWIAWQRLGNMSPEEAMERYIALLASIVPEWMNDHSSAEMEKSSKEQTYNRSDDNLMACTYNQSSSTSERTSEPSDLADNSMTVNEMKE